MRILLTNDDGVMAEGIQALAKILEKDHDITIVAPETQKSAQSHAITIIQPLVVKEVKLEGIESKAYSISGTPADCVRAGLDTLVGGKVDLVLSGINSGLNSGMDILYSGTVSAAIEANIYQIPSVAISTEWVDGNVRFDVAARYTKLILEKAMDSLLESNIVLNINVPYLDDKDIEGIKVCKIGGPVYDYYFVDQNEKGERTLKLQGRKIDDTEEGSDRYYLSKNYVTVTPLHYDLTNFKLLNEVENWLNREY